jgi:hypothetical protein
VAPRSGSWGVIADAALADGGRVTGVITESLSDHEIAHGGLARLDVVRTMRERKNRMAELSDAFVMLPGGFGTFEEFMEAVTWRQLAIHEKPSGILNVDGYFADPLTLWLTPSRWDSSGRTTQPRSQSPRIRRLCSTAWLPNHASRDGGRLSSNTLGVGQRQREPLGPLRIGKDSGATNRQRECPSAAPCASHH